nr:MAG TPA: hypothetical protein [Caudoviricetes sp.]
MNKKVTFQCPTCGKWVTRVADADAMSTLRGEG